MTASPAELRLMLFDGAIRFAEQAKTGLANRDYEAAFNGITRCQDIVMELINGLRPEHDPELCEKLSALYTFIYSRLIVASTQRDPETLEEALSLLRYERETWAMVLERLSQENSRAGQMVQTPQAAQTLPPNGTASNGAAPDAPAGPNGGSQQLVGGRISIKG